MEKEVLTSHERLRGFESTLEYASRLSVCVTVRRAVLEGEVASMWGIFVRTRAESLDRRTCRAEVGAERDEMDQQWASRREAGPIMRVKRDDRG